MEWRRTCWHQQQPWLRVFAPRTMSRSMLAIGIAIMAAEHVFVGLTSGHYRGPPVFRRQGPQRDLHRSTRATRQQSRARWGCFQGIYCVNLDHRRDRWAYMQRQFQELGMPVKRWPAVDGASIDIQLLVEGGELHSQALSRFMLPDEQKVFGIDLTHGAVGCALSHMQIWIDIMSRNGQGEFGKDERSAMFLILEDDCEFLPSFCEDTFMGRLAEVPDDWQLVFLGGVDALGWQSLLQVSPGVRRVYNGSRETTAYIMNVEGVRTALEVCFPLMWQLDTQLTLQGHPCDFNPELVYTTCPMSYIFWPPLVEQNKKDFGTDVQKDEHPSYLYGDKSYSVFLDPVSQNTKQLLVQAAEAGLNAQRFFLVGSWNGWNEFHEMLLVGGDTGTVFSTQVEMLGEEPVEFQLLCDNDWNQRIFPTAQGEILLGPSSAAHGKNWKVQPPLHPSALQVRWNPNARQPLRFAFVESTSVALSRTYALRGSWDDWESTTELKKKGRRSTVYSATICLSGGEDVEFQVECNGDHGQSMFPSPKGDRILGPSAEGDGKNWRLSVPPGAAFARIYWDPTGDRCISWTVDSSGATSGRNGEAAREPAGEVYEISCVT